MAMLALQRSEILRGDDEFALVSERDALAAAGIVPAETYGRALRDEGARPDLRTRSSDARRRTRHRLADGGAQAR